MGYHDALKPLLAQVMSEGGNGQEITLSLDNPRLLSSVVWDDTIGMYYYTYIDDQGFERTVYLETAGSIGTKAARPRQVQCAQGFAGGAGRGRRGPQYLERAAAVPAGRRPERRIEPVVRGLHALRRERQRGRAGSPPHRQPAGDDAAAGRRRSACRGADTEQQWRAAGCSARGRPFAGHTGRRPTPNLLQRRQAPRPRLLSDAAPAVEPQAAAAVGSCRRRRAQR